MEIYGPDKIGTYYTSDLQELIDRINKEISETEDNRVVVYVSREQADKYKLRLEKLYTNAGWDEVDFDFDYDWEYETVEMTLRKRDY